MKKQLIWITIAGLILTVVVIVAAVAMLGSINSSSESTADPEASIDDVAPEALVEQRPDCPSTGIGGVDLECLGGANGEAAQDAGTTVVNVWAWWCGPCRDELPHFDQFAAEHPEYDVVGVHADTNPGNGSAMLNELGIEMPSYQDDDNSFAGNLGLPGVIPITVVFVDGQQVGMFATPFDSAADLETAVAGVVGDVNG
ncbi:TlpA family protein disulfide reductase [Corynebacterium alimapuense]|uniref:TlpA family protein disulfide reductase n=1 Tax=Corynebacterium alimapuense TaxID=1576874 RepID=A0A3M8K723_9CORY|nr:TlpA disulfide reductase family protein [Corynebacterium alimapuense]RNE49017.1 TlpA family protein disulfide reductase [Corynebacterium alimapuense]